MEIKLVDVPGLDIPTGTKARWRVVTLEIDGRNPAYEQLAEWYGSYDLADKIEKPGPEFKKIAKSMVRAATREIVRSDQFVVKSTNPKHGDVYELRAPRGHARIMFFYDDDSESLIVCTNPYSKGKGHSNKAQDQAFAHCAFLKEKYLQWKKEQ